MIRNDLQLKLRLPPGLKTQIEADAKAGNRSMNAEIVARLEAGSSVLEYLRQTTEQWKALAESREDELAALRLAIGGRLAVLAEALSAIAPASARVDNSAMKRLRDVRNRAVHGNGKPEELLMELASIAARLAETLTTPGGDRELANGED